MTLVQANDVHVHFPVGQRVLGRAKTMVRAVNGVSLVVNKGTILGIVGESGCGKSTLAKALIGLRPLTSGQVEFGSTDLSTVKGRERRALRKRMQIVFQDPYASLNPRMTVGQTLAEPVVEHRLRQGRDAVDSRVAELLDLVGLRIGMVDRFPHELSGGQRQRVAIARALALEPEFIVCDEPISALDVSIQAQILNLLMDLQKRLDLTYVFVSHDLAVVRRVCDEVAVMYLGRVVERGTRDQIYGAPTHPYTVALLAAVPSVGKAASAGGPIKLTGELPSPTEENPGCPFSARCWLFQQLGQPERCTTTVPELSEAGEGQVVACHFPSESVIRSKAASVR